MVCRGSMLRCAEHCKCWTKRFALFRVSVHLEEMHQYISGFSLLEE